MRFGRDSLSRVFTGESRIFGSLASQWQPWCLISGRSFYENISDARTGCWRSRLTVCLIFAMVRVDGS
jgi:hypothetical protein